MAQPFWQKASVQTALISGPISAFAVILAVWLPSFLEAPKLKVENQKLMNDLADKNHQIQEIQTLLVPFKTIAFQNFTGTEAERLAQLALKLNDIQKGLESLNSNQSELKAKTEQINTYASEAKHKTEELERIVTKASTAQASLAQISDFNMTLTRANNDDRAAFDDLLKLMHHENDSNAALAKQAAVKIATDISGVLTFDTDLLKVKFNAGTALVSEYREFLANAPRPDFAATAVSKIMDQERFRKKIRLQLLVDIISETKSIRVLHAACMALNREAKIDRNIIGWTEYIVWWASHENDYL